MFYAVIRFHYYAGETDMFSVAPAIGHAIAGTTGARRYAPPMTPERVWRALRESRRASPRHKP
jgi:hypothetical protein